MNMRANIIALGLALAVLNASGCAVTHHKETFTTDSAIDDKTIVATIRARHAESVDLALSYIRVESLYGVVLLSGFAMSPAEKTTAEQIAAEVDGVKAVHNEIRIQADDINRGTAPHCPRTNHFVLPHLPPGATTNETHQRTAFPVTDCKDPQTKV